MQLLFFAFFVLLHPQSTAGYTAAVVEFSADRTTPNATERTQNNLKGFKEAIESARNKGAQIVVFPEDAINGAIFFTTRKEIFPYLEEIPDIELPLTEAVIPCLDIRFDDRLVLKTLSCLARQYNLVLVANMGEKKYCNWLTDENCPPDGNYQFNTNVVFEKDGELIAKYRKINLYGSEGLLFDKGGKDCNCVSFSTSFGVVFGTFTCYDILYEDPSHCLLAKSVRNFVFPTAWGNSFAFYMSTSLQQSWSLQNRANLLAANGNLISKQPQFYSTGSGIYSSGVALKYFLSGKPLNNAMGSVIVTELSDIPYNNSLELITQTRDLRQEGSISDVGDIHARSTSYLQYVILDGIEGMKELKVESQSGLGLSCSLSYKKKLQLRSSIELQKQIHEETYAIGGYIGRRKDTDFFYAVCSFVKCASNTIDSCGHVVPNHLAETVFESFHLSGIFPGDGKPLATALANGLELFSTQELKITNKELEISSAKPILAASLWMQVHPSTLKTNDSYVLYNGTVSPQSQVVSQRIISLNGGYVHFHMWLCVYLELLLRITLIMILSVLIPCVIFVSKKKNFEY